jgi:hypothetical protein
MDAVAAAAERWLTKRRATGHHHATALEQRLVREGYRVESFEEAGRGWAVKVYDPRDARLWMTLWCVIADGRAAWEWVSTLPRLPADDLDGVLSFIQRWIGAA